MSDSIIYTPRPDATPEGGLNTLASVYRFILFESNASKKGGPATAPDDAMKGPKHDRAEQSIQK